MLKSFFKDADKNGDEFLSKPEIADMIGALVVQSGFPTLPEGDMTTMVNSVFDSADVNKDGNVDFSGE